MEALLFFPLLESQTLKLAVSRLAGGLPYFSTVKNLVRPYCSLPTVKNLVLPDVDRRVGNEIFENLISAFPNLECLEFDLRFLRKDLVCFNIRHQNLKSIRYGGFMHSSVFVDCPKLTSLELSTIPEVALILKSSDCLKSLSVGNGFREFEVMESRPNLELPKDFGGISHLTFAFNGLNGLNAGKFLNKLFQKSVNTMEKLVVQSRRSFAQIRKSVINIEKTFKFSSLKVWTFQNLDDDWITYDWPISEFDTSTTITKADCPRHLKQQCLDLHELLSICPSLR